MADVKAAAEESFETMVKAVVDVERRIMAIGGELHADANAVLLEHGSRPQDLWGINIYPAKPRNEWIEFISLINIRPAAGNRSMKVKDPLLRKRIEDTVNDLCRIETMTPIHKDLATGRRATLNVAEQLAHIGSEVSRVIHWQVVGDNGQKEKALERALELLDLTLADTSSSARASELARLREVLCDVLAGGNEYGTSLESLEEYFLPFALRAMH